jgi:hypothetical protein
VCKRGAPRIIFHPHVIAFLHLINQKGLNELCRKLAKLLEKQAGTLAELCKSIGFKGLNSKEDQEAHWVEIKQTTDMLEHDKAAAKMQNLAICNHPPQYISYVSLYRPVPIFCQQFALSDLSNFDAFYLPNLSC